MTNKQAVVNTPAGTFVIDLRPDLAPNHVGYFMKLAREGEFNGTVFHRVIRHGIIQGGDPLSKDPAKAKAYGTGGLGVLKAELAAYRAVLETTSGPITISFTPDKAPGHVRAFLRLAQAGVFDGTSFHRVVPGFVVQIGSLDTRGPLSEKQQRLVRPLAPEFTDTPHVRGIVSMARGDDPGSATTSFFIVVGMASSLDRKYSAFGRVEDGMVAVEAIEKTPVNGETPVSRIEVTRVRLIK